MRVVIAYESMFGNTRRIAESLAAGAESAGAAVQVLPITDVKADTIEGVDLFVMGAPTHVHGLPRRQSRTAAREMADKPASGVTLEPGADGDGVREWFAGAGLVNVRAAAFDTKMHGPATFTGRASRRIARLLRGHGASLVASPESFIVSKDNQLDPGETERAEAWGRTLVRSVAASLPPSVLA